MIKKYTTEAKINNISACMDFIENELAGLKISRNESIQSILSAEEVLAAEIKHADENASITVTVSHQLPCYWECFVEYFYVTFNGCAWGTGR